MTAQIDDRFAFQEGLYCLAGISEGDLFDPSVLELDPSGTSTACYRGYAAIFGLCDSRLILDRLHINLLSSDGDDVVGPIINGVAPTGSQSQHDWFNNHYQGLNYHFEYSGGLLIADDFIEDLYVHMGFHPAWKYGKVIELIFEHGVLRRVWDRSSKMDEIRTCILGDDESSDDPQLLNDDVIRDFIERAFDRSYDL
jgi:hypothetical protein